MNELIHVRSGEGLILLLKGCPEIFPVSISCDCGGISKTDLIFVDPEIEVTGSKKGHIRIDRDGVFMLKCLCKTCKQILTIQVCVVTPESERFAW